MNPPSSSSINMEALTQHDHPRYFQEAVSPHAKDAPMPTMNDWLSSDPPWTALQDDSSMAGTGMNNARSFSQLTGTRTAPTPTPAPQNPFMTYRNNDIRSECETMPDDSGYRSFVPSSIGSTSIYDDAPYALSQDLDSDVANFEIQFGDAASINGSYDARATTEPRIRSVSNPDANLRCDTCQTDVKTKSELKKHQLRHQRPWSCPHQDCPRSRLNHGFASHNDLTRHQMTVHRNHSLGKTYACRHGACARKEPKPWPRADNFRSHLKRVHAIEMSADADLSRYIYSSGYAHPEDLSGLGTNHQDALNILGGQELMPGSFMANRSIEEFPEIPTPAASSTPYMSAIAPDSLLMPPPSTSRSSRRVAPAASARRSQSGRYSSGGRASAPSSDSASTIGPPRSNRATKEEPFTSAPASRSSFDTQDLSGEELSSVSSSNESVDGTEILQKPVLPSEASRAESASITALDTNLNQDDLMKYLKTVPKSLLQEALAGSSEEVKSEDKPAASSSGDLVCTQCKKPFPRMCELRKHLKRHERPYGCTVLGCDKEFGSKNDWKRHENGQHPEEDLWQCDNAEQGCKLFFGKQKAYEDHVRQCNPMLKDVDIQNKVSLNRLGSRNRDAYWCGFCKDVLKVLPEQGIDTEQRFNHIDDHFMGRRGFQKQKIAAWLYPQVTESPTEDASEPGRKRKTSVDSEERPSKQAHKQRR